MSRARRERGSFARAHKEKKNEIREALGEEKLVKCYNNESGVGEFRFGERCPTCRTPRFTRKVKFGVGDGGSDLIVLVGNETGIGRTVFGEVKTGSAIPRANQNRFKELVELLGFTYEVWREPEDAIVSVRRERERVAK